MAIPILQTKHIIDHSSGPIFAAALTGRLTPLGTAVGGLLGEFLPIRAAITSFFCRGTALHTFCSLAVDGIAK